MSLFTPEPAHEKSDGRERVFALLLFGALLAFHGWGASVGWKNFNLPGMEFRQAQTAISAYFIQRDHDFSLAYPTPVLGKPWSVPLEFPLYQWTVVKLSDFTGLDLTKAGRAVSLACFYLTLPGIFVLLGRAGLAWPGRLVALGFVLSCPLYIFYGRAFLIETMALMFAVWFLVGYLNAVEHRRFGWLVFTSLAGCAAGLVKVTTFLFILMPALGWTGVWLWRQRPGISGVSWRDRASTAGWALGAVALPCLAAAWWVRFGDATKALNPMADFLRSERLTTFNFGSADTRFSAEIWRLHLTIIFREIVAWGTLGAAGLMAVCGARHRWRWILLLVVCFFAVQLLFPLLYAWHDYYYVANAFTLLLAIGLVACGMLESRMSRMVVWGAILTLHLVQMEKFVRLKLPIQQDPNTGGNPMTEILRTVTEPDDVLIIAGSDWSSGTPYMARRRALMIRNGKEFDYNFIAQGFAQLRGESVGALIVQGRQRENAGLVGWANLMFGLDPRPVFTFSDSTVYLNRRLRLSAIPRIQALPADKLLQLTPESLADGHALLAHEVELIQLAPGYAQQQFAGMSPRPFKYYMTFGLGRMNVEGRDLFFAHPDTRLWFRTTPGPHVMAVDLQILAAAYAESVPVGDQTDGVGLSIFLEGPDQVRRSIFSRRLNPRVEPSDRGLQVITQQFEAKPDEVVLVEIDSGPEGKPQRDWVVLDRVEIK